MARLVLVGMPGSGKSTIGRALASTWSCPWIDTDDLFTSRHGLTPADMIRRNGESLFRQAEVDLLVEALSSDGVVATGGGVVSTEAGRARLLEHGAVLWLRVSAATGLARVRGGDRPLLAGDLDATYRHTLEERRAWYEAVATWTIDADADVASVIASVEEIVQG